MITYDATLVIACGKRLSSRESSRQCKGLEHSSENYGALVMTHGTAAPLITEVEQQLSFNVIPARHPSPNVSNIMTGSKATSGHLPTRCSQRGQVPSLPGASGSTWHFIVMMKRMLGTRERRA